MASLGRKRIHAEARLPNKSGAKADFRGEVDLSSTSAVTGAHRGTNPPTLWSGDYLLPSRTRRSPHISTR
jgi:hypothetical protein